VVIIVIHFTICKFSRKNFNCNCKNNCKTGKFIIYYLSGKFPFPHLYYNWQHHH